MSNGTITLTIAGGTSPYNYDWSNVAGTTNSQNQTGLPAGTYTVTVTDAGTCTTITSVVLTSSAGPTLVTSLGNPACGGNNGSIDLTVNGGIPPYIYDWSNDGTGDNNDPEDISGLTVGTHTVTVTDANNCTATTALTLTTNSGPTLSASSIDATSCATNNGSINLTVTGGTLPYYYDWSNDGEPAPDFDTEDLSTLTQGNYTVTVTDGNGCTATISQSVGLTNGAVLAVVVTDPVNCAQTGSVDLTITGGVAPISIDWNNIPGANDPEDQTGLLGGVYQVTVVEGNGCTTVESVSIRDIREPVATVIVTQPTCGMIDGLLTLTIVGGDGVGPYNFDWSNIAGTNNPEDQSGIGSGNYTVTITDELQCTSTLVVNLSASAAPQISVVVTNRTCSLNNGAIDLTITGGTPAYSITGIICLHSAIPKTNLVCRQVLMP